VPGPLDEAAALRTLGRVEDLAVLAEREDRQLEAEHVEEDQPEPDRVDRDPDQHEDHRGAV
jgi:hypothetical protein